MPDWSTDIEDAMQELAQDNARLMQQNEMLIHTLEAVRKQAEPREWETPGHPMNEWTKREPILRIVDDALGHLRQAQG